jgi:hypothetical protein
MQKSYYNPKFISGQAPTTSGGVGGTGDVTLDDPTNVQVDNLAVFSTVGAKRLKTTSSTLLPDGTLSLTKLKTSNIESANGNIAVQNSNIQITNGSLFVSSNINCNSDIYCAEVNSSSNLTCTDVYSQLVETQNNIESVLGDVVSRAGDVIATAGDLRGRDLYLSGEIKSPDVTPGTSVITSNIDYSPGEMLVSAMRSNITAASGGVNKCWGRTASFYCGTAGLLAGRVVSLQDFASQSDAVYNLRIGYCPSSGDEKTPSVCPLGILQNNCPNVGDKAVVCIEGVTTAICGNSDSSPARGSQICAVDANGTININVTGVGNEARVGFVAQNDSVSTNGVCLIYVRPWYQPY